jgi:hypothetical protein
VAVHRNYPRNPVRHRRRRGDRRERDHSLEGRSVRGVNLMRVQNGRIAEALGYVKGA